MCDMVVRRGWHRAPAGTGRDLSWQLTVEGQAANVLGSGLRYRPPSLTRVSSGNGRPLNTSGGELVLFEGSGFGCNFAEAVRH